MVNGKFQFWRITWRLTWALALCPLVGCAPSEPGETVHFWAMGREGEVVRQLVPEFEQRNPGVTVKVQQIPWSAAHEKLLTAYCRNQKECNDVA